jgi:hypothetical protein
MATGIRGHRATLSVVALALLVGLLAAAIHYANQKLQDVWLAED